MDRRTKEGKARKATYRPTTKKSIQNNTFLRETRMTYL